MKRDDRRLLIEEGPLINTVFICGVQAGECGVMILFVLPERYKWPTVLSSLTAASRPSQR